MDAFAQGLLDILKDTLRRLTPNKQSIDEKNVPLFQIYSTTCDSLTSCVQANIPEALKVKFGVDVLTLVISIAQNIADAVRITHTHLSSYVGYIGELLQFVDALKPLVNPKREELLHLLQRFWICCVLFSAPNISIVFKEWDYYLTGICQWLPPLIKKPLKGEFAATKYRVQELLQLIQLQSISSKENLIQIILELIRSMNAKYIQALDVADALP